MESLSDKKNTHIHQGSRRIPMTDSETPGAHTAGSTRAWLLEPTHQIQDLPGLALGYNATELHDNRLWEPLCLKNVPLLR